MPAESWFEHRLRQEIAVLQSGGYPAPSPTARSPLNCPKQRYDRVMAREDKPREQQNDHYS